LFTEIDFAIFSIRIGADSSGPKKQPQPCAIAGAKDLSINN